MVSEFSDEGLNTYDVYLPIPVTLPFLELTTYAHMHTLCISFLPSILPSFARSISLSIQATPNWY